MLFSTAGQGWVFLGMVAAGALIGAWYGLLAALRRLLSAGTWLSLAADAAFGAGAAAIFCGALVLADDGRARIYDFLAAALGFALFAVGVFPAAQASARALARGVRHIFVKIRSFRWINVIFR